ncbi:MAG: domain S-box-containing protein [Mucilaginibacter sp.]|nr:domain S-box-containing protein [Mucilaginibacter sp.]
MRKRKRITFTMITNTNVKAGAFKITAIYIVTGILWIALSDRLLDLMQDSLSTSVLFVLASIKGFAFVLLTGLMLYKLILSHNNNLLKSENQYRLYFEDNPTPMWIYSIDTLQFIAVNHAAVAHYGYSEEEFKKMRILDIRPAEDIQKAIVAIKSLQKGLTNSGIWTHRKKNGDLIQVQISSQPITSGGKQTIMTMATDVTELKRIEAERNDYLFKLEEKDIQLELALERYAMASRATQDMLYEFNILENKLSYAQNYGYFSGMDLSKEEDPATAWMNLVHPHDVDKLADARNKALDIASDKYECEYRMDCGNKSYRYVYDQASIIYDQDGRPLRMIGAVKDITDLKEKEAALLRQNNMLREIAWVESHEVRRPLASMLSLIELIKTSDSEDEKKELFDLMDISARELDAMVCKVSHKINEVTEQMSIAPVTADASL